MGFGLEKKIVYPLFFLFFWITAFPLFAEEEKGEDRESDRKPLLHLGQWEFDAGGQVRLRGDSAPKWSSSTPEILTSILRGYTPLIRSTRRDRSRVIFFTIKAGFPSMMGSLY